MLRPNDIVRPSALCLATIRRFRSEHRGVVMAYPDRYRTVLIKWNHKPKVTLMARRYIDEVRHADNPEV